MRLVEVVSVVALNYLAFVARLVVLMVCVVPREEAFERHIRVQSVMPFHEVLDVVALGGVVLVVPGDEVLHRVAFIVRMVVVVLLIELYHMAVGLFLRDGLGGTFADFRFVRLGLMRVELLVGMLAIVPVHLVVVVLALGALMLLGFLRRLEIQVVVVILVTELMRSENFQVRILFAIR